MTAGGEVLVCNPLGVGGRLLYTAGSVGLLGWPISASVSRSIFSWVCEFLSRRLRARLSDILRSLPTIRVHPSCGLFGVDRIQGVYIIWSTFRSRLNRGIDCTGAFVCSRLIFLPGGRVGGSRPTFLFCACRWWGSENLISSWYYMLGFFRGITYSGARFYSAGFLFMILPLPSTFTLTWMNLNSSGGTARIQLRTSII